MIIAASGLKDFRLPFDEPIYRVINAGMGFRWLDAIFVLVSSREFGAALAVLMGVWLFAALGRGALRPIVLATISAIITDKVGHQLIKPFVGRLRPCYAMTAGSFRQLCEVANSGSMPSLHSASAFAVATSIALVWPFSARLVYPVAALIAVSRVAVGVHWPSDILAGAFFGSLVSLLVHLIAERVVKRPRPIEPLTA